MSLPRLRTTRDDAVKELPGTSLSSVDWGEYPAPNIERRLHTAKRALKKLAASFSTKLIAEFHSSPRLASPTAAIDSARHAPSRKPAAQRRPSSSRT